MTGDDLERLDPRADLARIQQGIAERLAAGEPVTALYQVLAERDPVALVQVALGPKAPSGGAAVRAALPLVEVLEGGMTPSGLYRRLVDLAAGQGEVEVEVLRLAATRHPLARWLVALSERIEGPAAGSVHLEAALDHPGFTAVCWSYAQAGARAGLVAVAGQAGRPEPAAALLAWGHLDASATAAARALERDPDAPVVPWLAGVWGPDVDCLLARIIPHLRSEAAARALAAHADGLPRTTTLLSAILPALVGR